MYLISICVQLHDVVAHGFFALTCYISLIRYVNNQDQNREVASALGHGIEIEVPNNLTNEGIIYIIPTSKEDIETFIQEEFELQNQQFMERLNMEGPLEESRKISLLSVEIKVSCTIYDVQKKVQGFCWYSRYVGKACFILFQALEVWGLMYYFSNYDVNEAGCGDLYNKFLFVVGHDTHTYIDSILGLVLILGYLHHGHTDCGVHATPVVLLLLRVVEGVGAQETRAQTHR